MYLNQFFRHMAYRKKYLKGQNQKNFMLMLLARLFQSTPETEQLFKNGFDIVLIGHKNHPEGYKHNGTTAKRFY